MGKRKRVSQSTTQDDIVIPEDEQWRIIGESSILQGVERHSKLELNDDDSDAERLGEPYIRTLNEDNEEERQTGDWPDSIFQAVLLIVPMCFLYAMMDLSVCNIRLLRA
jgi:hypothetical protein